MNKERYLLDTSALLTLIEDEAGASRVEEILRDQQALITWMSLLEVYYITQQERGAAEADRRYALLKVLPTMLIWGITEPMLLQAARFKATYRLSLADTIIASCAAQEDAILLHKDPQFEVLTGQIKLESLPYKGNSQRSP